MNSENKNISPAPPPPATPAHSPRGGLMPQAAPISYHNLPAAQSVVGFGPEDSIGDTASPFHIHNVVFDPPPGSSLELDQVRNLLFFPFRFWPIGVGGHMRPAPPAQWQKRARFKKEPQEQQSSTPCKQKHPIVPAAPLPFEHIFLYSSQELQHPPLPAPLATSLTDLPSLWNRATAGAGGIRGSCLSVLTWFPRLTRSLFSSASR